jgi:Icc-related predicted phosphoesterase
LWSDFWLIGDAFERRHAMHLAAQHINDFQKITIGKSIGQCLRFKPGHAAARHTVSCRFIEDELSRRFSGPTVIVSHFLPSPLSISEKYRGNPYNPYFCSDLTALIERWQPELWIHGHTHESCDYSIGRTRVVCNPRGYLPHEANPRFRPDLTVAL